MTTVDEKTIVWACTSAGGCVAGFVSSSLPYLQFLALAISIAAGIRAFLVSRKK
jgi:hypothetical protein